MLPGKKQLLYRLLPSIVVGLLIQLVLAGIFYLDHEKVSKLNLAITGITLFCVSVLWLVFSVRSILKISLAVETIHEASGILSAGGYPDRKKIDGKDQLSEVSENLHALASSLQVKSDFMTHISKGNLEVGYVVSGNDDLMGKALLEIKDNLVRMKAEEKQRAWSTEALAKFVELLQSSADIKVLCNTIIVNMVKTLRANQGAIFILTQREGGDEYLEMQACYAYDRNKHLSMKIEIGQGLIGQAYLEKETIYLKDIPDNFVRITSGLGDANPRNILITPLKIDSTVVGIVEMATFREFASHEIMFAEKIGESIAHTITSLRLSANTRTMLKEAEERAEEMRAQEEELRQNQEELQATQEEVSRKYTELFSKLKDLNRQSKFDQLLSITFAKKRNIEYYFDIIRNQIITFSEDKMILDAMKAFAAAFKTIDVNVSERKLAAMNHSIIEYYEHEFIPRLNDNTNQIHQVEKYIPGETKATTLQYHYISNNAHPTGQKSMLNDPLDGSEYSKVHAAYHPIIRSYLEKFGYYDIFLLDSITGELVYSVFKEVDYATNMITGLYSTTNFGKVVQEVIASQDRDIVRLIDFETYAPSYNAPASFIAKPVYDGDIKIGIVVFQMPINKVNQILTGDNHWREDGQGDSGETFMVGNDYRLRSITRGMIENADRYLNALKRQGYADDVIRQIGKTGTNILLENLKLNCITKALNGKSGQQLEKNANGVESLYTYAPLAIADVTWVIVSTLSDEEASERIESLRNS